jgi:hypothetical protein
MLEKPVQQGRRERKAEEVHTALRAIRSPFGWILANGKTPPAISPPRFFFNVEALSDARTLLEGFCNILRITPMRGSMAGQHTHHLLFSTETPTA